jgi:hypothetical protein
MKRSCTYYVATANCGTGSVGRGGEGNKENLRREYKRKKLSCLEEETLSTLIAVPTLVTV